MKKDIHSSKFAKGMALSVAALLFPLLAFSQVRIDWQQCYGNVESRDWAASIAPTDDGFLVLGQVYYPLNEGLCSCATENDHTPWLIRIDRQGKMVRQYCWDDEWGYTHACEPISIRKANSQNSKEYYLSLHRWGRVIITKLNDNEEELWRKELDWFGNSICPTDDGGLFLGGSLGYINKNENDTLLKMDSDGNTEWGLSLGLTDLNSADATKVYQTNEGAYYAIVNITSGSALYKIGRTGQIEWRRDYGRGGNDVLSHLVELEDGFLLGGRIVSEIEGHHGDRSDVWLVRTDKEGEVQWERCYGGSYFDGCSTVFSNPNGGFTVFANSHSNDGDVQSNSQGNPDIRRIWIFHVDAFGNLQWERSIGTADYPVSSNGVIQTKAYSYVVAGWMPWEESPSGDVNCSNNELLPESKYNFWVFQVTDTLNSTDLPEPMSKANAQVYPNPTQGTVFIQGIEPVEVQVYNAKGQWVRSFQGTNEIPVGDLPKGLYCIKAILEDGTTFSDKVVKE